MARFVERQLEKSNLTASTSGVFWWRGKCTLQVLVS